MRNRLKEYLIDDRNFENIEQNYGDVAKVCEKALRDYGHYVGYVRNSSSQNSNKRIVIWNLERIIKFVGGVENLAGKTFDTGDLEFGKKYAQYLIKDTTQKNVDIYNDDEFDEIDRDLVFDIPANGSEYVNNDRWAKAEIFNERLILNAVADAARKIGDTLPSTVEDKNSEEFLKAPKGNGWEMKSSVPIIKSVSTERRRVNGRIRTYHRIEFGDFQTNANLMYFFMAAMNQKIWASFNALRYNTTEIDDVGTMGYNTNRKIAHDTAIDNAQFSYFPDWFNFSLLAIIKGIKEPTDHLINRRTNLESKDSFNDCFFNTNEVLYFLGDNPFNLTKIDGTEVGIFGAIASRLFNKKEESSKMATTFLGKLIHELRDKERNPSDCINTDVNNIALKSLESSGEDNSKLDAKPLGNKEVYDWQDYDKNSAVEGKLEQLVDFLLSKEINDKVADILSQRKEQNRAYVGNKNTIAIEIFISLVANIENLSKLIVSSNRFKIKNNYELKNFLVQNLGAYSSIKDFVNDMGNSAFLSSINVPKKFNQLNDLNNIPAKNGGGYLSYFDYEKDENGKFVKRTKDTYKELNEEFISKFRNVPVSRKSIMDLTDIVSRLLKFDIKISATQITRSFSLQLQSKNLDLGSTDNYLYQSNKLYPTTISQAFQYIISRVNTKALDLGLAGSGKNSFMNEIKGSRTTTKKGRDGKERVVKVKFSSSELLKTFKDILDSKNKETDFFDNYTESKKRLFNKIYMKSFKESLFNRIYNKSI